MTLKLVSGPAFSNTYDGKELYLIDKYNLEQKYAPIGSCEDFYE